LKCPYDARTAYGRTSKELAPMSQKPTIPMTCVTCGQSFLAQPYEVARGRGRFCSVDCHNTSQRIPFETYLAQCTVDANGCWLWSGTRTPSGYGQLLVGGERGKTQRAHRVAFETAYGPIPDGLLVLHTCDNRACVRNDDVGWYEVNGILLPRRGHLFLGTQQDNMNDKVAKGRQAIGDRNGKRIAKNRRTQNRDAALNS
jgi:hypothetical protein